MFSLGQENPPDLLESLQVVLEIQTYRILVLRSVKKPLDRLRNFRLRHDTYTIAIGLGR